MTERDAEDYGFEDEDGPDVTRAREALEESSTQTDEIDVILTESRRLVEENLGYGYRNHFAQKWAHLLRGSAA
jgi:hypothetical protein